MKTFFILYWTTFILGYMAYRSYQNYHRQHVLRHQYAERHREQMARRQRARSQLQLFH